MASFVVVMLEPAAERGGAFDVACGEPTVNPFGLQTPVGTLNLPVLRTDPSPPGRVLQSSPPGMRLSVYTSRHQLAVCEEASRLWNPVLSLRCNQRCGRVLLGGDRAPGLARRVQSEHQRPCQADE